MPFQNDDINSISTIKTDIITTFNEDFYLIYIDNSDGVSGLKSIKEKFTPIEIEEILDKTIENKFITLYEKYENSPILDNILNVITLFKGLDKIVKNNKTKILSKSHFEELEKIAIKRMNKKNGESLTKDEWLVKIPDLNDTLLHLISKKWNNAYEKNYNQSLRSKYWKFEENIILNNFQTTLEYF